LSRSRVRRKTKVCIHAYRSSTSFLTICREAFLQLRITATMERIAWRSAMQSERGVVCEKGAVAKKAVFSLTNIVNTILQSEFRQPSQRWCHSYTALRNGDWIFPSCAPGLNAEKFARSDVD